MTDAQVMEALALGRREASGSAAIPKPGKRKRLTQALKRWEKQRRGDKNYY